MVAMIAGCTPQSSSSAIPAKSASVDQIDYKSIELLNEKIDQIKAITHLSAKDEPLLTEADALLNQLSKEELARVNDRHVIPDAVDQLRQIKANLRIQEEKLAAKIEAKADAKKIARAIVSLSPISELSLKSEEKIDIIRARYNGLSAFQKKYIKDYYPRLEKAEDRMEALHRQAKIEAARKAQQISEVAYVTNTGSKYHRSGCQYLWNSSIKTTVSDARASGYSACSKCW